MSFCDDQQTNTLHVDFKVKCDPTFYAMWFFQKQSSIKANENMQIYLMENIYPLQED